MQVDPVYENQISKKTQTLKSRKHISESLKQERNTELLESNILPITTSRFHIQTNIKKPADCCGGTLLESFRNQLQLFRKNPSPWSSNCLQSDFQDPVFQDSPAEAVVEDHSFVPAQLGNKKPGFSMSLEATFPKKK